MVHVAGGNKAFNFVLYNEEPYIDNGSPNPNDFAKTVKISLTLVLHGILMFQGI